MRKSASVANNYVTTGERVFQFRAATNHTGSTSPRLNCIGRNVRFSAIEGGRIFPGLNYTVAATSPGEMCPRDLCGLRMWSSPKRDTDATRTTAPNRKAPKVHPSGTGSRKCWPDSAESRNSASLA